jgi:nucleoside-diphosphate-sugar epimerase
MSRKNILVIGGAGFIGSVLCPLLADLGHSVTVFDKKPKSDANTDLDYIHGDVRDREEVSKAMVMRDVVYNLAAEHQDNVRPLSLYTEVNVEGAHNVCAAATELGVRHIIFTSSVAVYGSHDFLINEDTPHLFFNEYGRSKHLAEQVHLAWLKSADDNRLTIVRPTVVFGPGNRGNVYNLLRQLKYGPFVMFGDGLNVKSLAHVGNISSFLSFLADRRERCGIYNYADKPDFNMRDLVQFVDRQLGKRNSRRARLPEGLGVLAGHVADGLSVVTGRNLPVSAVRVKKFCASSAIDSSRAVATGFTPPNELRASLQQMVINHV